MLADGQEGGVYNLGRSIGYSVSEFLSAIFSEAGQTMPPGYYPRRSGDPPALIADPSAAQSVLDFNPIHSDLETIIRTAWKWHIKGRTLNGRREIDKERFRLGDSGSRPGGRKLQFLKIRAMTCKTTNKFFPEITEISREHFMQAVDNELAKFEHHEAALRAADRNERASKFGLLLTMFGRHPIRSRDDH
jgi:hypothetical protein